MDTVYCNLSARRLKVSGGPDLLRLVATPVAAPAAAGAGEVLDFERCRRRLETKAAWKDLEAAARTGEEPAPAKLRRDRRERWAGWLELCASAAVILVSVAAALAFFRV